MKDASILFLKNLNVLYSIRGATNSWRTLFWIDAAAWHSQLSGNSTDFISCEKLFDLKRISIMRKKKLDRKILHEKTHIRFLFFVFFETIYRKKWFLRLSRLWLYNWCFDDRFGWHSQYILQLIRERYIETRIDLRNIEFNVI